MGAGESRGGREREGEERGGQRRKGEGRGGGHMSSIFRFFFCSDILRPIFRILVKAK